MLNRTKKNASRKRSGKGKGRKRTESKLFLVLLLAVLYFLQGLLTDNEQSVDGLVAGQVVRVVDGDTLVVETEKQEEYKIRLIGVNTPETKHPQKGVEYFGKEASSFTTNLLENKTVYLEKDVSETDRYQRLLRYVWLKEAIEAVDFSKVSIEDVKKYQVNGLLVAEGYAMTDTVPPDLKYKEMYRQLEQEAREQEKGLWK